MNEDEGNQKVTYCAVKLSKEAIDFLATVDKSPNRAVLRLKEQGNQKVTCKFDAALIVDAVADEIEKRFRR